MGEMNLNVTEQEREYLVNLLENVLKNTRVEEHRTRAPAYREHILKNEELIDGLLKKLGQTANVD